MPAAETLSSTWPGPGSGSGTVTTSGLPPTWRYCTAFKRSPSLARHHPAVRERALTLVAREGRRAGVAEVATGLLREARAVVCPVHSRGGCAPSNRHPPGESSSRPGQAESPCSDYVPLHL